MKNPVDMSSPLSQFLRELNVTSSSIIIVDNPRRRPSFDHNFRVVDDEIEEAEDATKSPCPTAASVQEESETEELRRKQVSFCPKVSVAEYSFDTKTEDLFYTRQEYSTIQKDIKATLLRHQQDEDSSSSSSIMSTDDQVDCLRGLETFFDGAKEEKVRVRLSANLAVMTEQYRQWCEEGHETPVNADEMSRRYQKVSLECQRKASQRGMDDYRELCKILQQSPVSTRILKRRKRSLSSLKDMAPRIPAQIRSVSPSAA